MRRYISRAQLSYIEGLHGELYLLITRKLRNCCATVILYKKIPFKMEKGLQ